MTEESDYRKCVVDDFKDHRDRIRSLEFCVVIQALANLVIFGVIFAITRGTH